MLIRKYKSSDRSQVEFIHFETYLLGKSIGEFATNQKRFDKEIAYYLDKESESCFVAVDRGKVVGYLLGCLDDKKHDESIISFFFEGLIDFCQLPFMNSKDRRFWWSKIKLIFLAISGKSEDAKFKPPKDAGHLHINFLSHVRGKGNGTKLLKAFLKYAKSKKVKLIHADSWQTRLNPNSNFWVKNGFKEYLSLKTSFWRTQFPNEDIRLVCYVKNL
jgi:GNAT superfamily N-acetyltransferase